MSKPHILIVTFPAQGHINPALHFATRLLRLGVNVTFATCVSAQCRLPKSGEAPEGLSFAAFSNGRDEGFKLEDDSEQFMSDFRTRGMESLRDLIVDITVNQGRPINHIVYSNLVHCVEPVAREFRIPLTLLWNQPATVLDIYYYGDLIKENNGNDPSFPVKLPGLPPLNTRDVPSFLLPSNLYPFIRLKMEEHFTILDKETNPKVLVNTFEALEPEALKAIKNYNLVGVGPLIPFFDKKDVLMSKPSEYSVWLDSKKPASVIYVAFGSMSMSSRTQTEEIARALLDTGMPFLWVIKETEKEEEVLAGCRRELEEQGMIVPWCSQVEVLSHSSIGCFVTHCGWNSTIESLACGVPMVAFPQWSDQPTNAKMVQDEWKAGMRAVERYDGLVEADEIKRCVELVMGSDERGEGMRRNAKKWKDLATEAAMEGGSSDKNLKTFVEEVVSFMDKKLTLKVIPEVINATF